MLWLMVYVVFVVVVFVNLIAEERPKIFKRYVGDVMLSLLSIIVIVCYIASKVLEWVKMTHLSLLIDKYMAKFAGYFYIT